jgi:hypothetical protein
VIPSQVLQDVADEFEELLQKLRGAAEELLGIVRTHTAEELGLTYEIRGAIFSQLRLMEIDICSALDAIKLANSLDPS